MVVVVVVCVWWWRWGGSRQGLPVQVRGGPGGGTTRQAVRPRAARRPPPELHLGVGHLVLGGVRGAGSEDAHPALLLVAHGGRPCRAMCCRHGGCGAWPGRRGGAACVSCSEAQEGGGGGGARGHRQWRFGLVQLLGGQVGRVD